MKVSYDNYEYNELSEIEYELNKFYKVIDVDNLSHEKQISALINFVCDELMTKDNLRKLDISHKFEMEFRSYMAHAKAYLNKNITIEELVNKRVSVWEICDELEHVNATGRLARIIVCCLYEEDSEEFIPRDQLDLYFSLMGSLGDGYCKKFRVFLQSKWL